MIQCTLLINEATHVVWDHCICKWCLMQTGRKFQSYLRYYVCRMNWTGTRTINLEKWSDVYNYMNRRIYTVECGLQLTGGGCVLNSVDGVYV